MERIQQIIDKYKGISFEKIIEEHKDMMTNNIKNSPVGTKIMTKE